MSARSEARLQRLVKKKCGKVLRDIATEFNIRNGDHSASERTVQRYLHKKTYLQENSEKANGCERN